MTDRSSLVVWKLALGLLAGTALPAQKPEVRIDLGTPPGTVNSHSVQMAASGQAVYVVWGEERNGGADVYLNRSLDRGATWLPTDVRLNTESPSGAGVAGGPQIAAYGSIVYVIWQHAYANRRGRVGHRIFFNRSLDGGTTWLPIARRLDSSIPIASAVNPWLAVDGLSVYVSWRDTRNGMVNDVYFNRSLDGGTTWLPTDSRINASQVFEPAFFPGGYAQMLSVQGPAVYVAWVDHRNSGPFPFSASDIYFNRSLDAGRTWMANDVKIDVGSPPGSGMVSYLRLAALGSLVHVVWTASGGTRPAGIYYNRSTDGGSTWLSSDVRIGSGSGGLLNLRMAGNSVYLVWVDRASNGLLDIFFNRSLDGGVTWLPADVSLDTGLPSSVSSWLPRIAAAGSTVLVCWDNGHSVAGTQPFYINRSPDSGTTWLPAARGGERFGAGPCVATSGSSAYSVWRSRRNGNGVTDLYFSLESGYQGYGSGTAGSSGQVPLLDGSGLPAIGVTASLELRGGLGGATGLLLAGVGPSSRIAAPLLGGTQHVAPSGTIPLVLGGTPGVAGSGTHSLSLPIPFVPILMGVNLNFQGMFLDPGAPGGVSMSNGLETWIQ